MKVISILQPWATLVVIGAKKIETRSWNTKHRGELLIHASKKMDQETMNMMEHEPFWQFMKAYWPESETYKKFSKLPLGAIIGKVNLLHTVESQYCFEGNEFEVNNEKFHLTENEMMFGDYSANRYGWLLSDPVLFEKPVPCRGNLSLWNCPEEIIKQLPVTEVINQFNRNQKTFLR